MIWKYSIWRKQLEETLKKHSFKARRQIGCNISMDTYWETEVICPILPKSENQENLFSKSQKVSTLKMLPTAKKKLKNK